jgi:ABC-2 type transport system permease protein
MAVKSFAAQIVAALGYGRFFPNSVPSLYSGVAGPDQATVGPVGIGLVIMVGALTTLGTA